MGDYGGKDQAKRTHNSSLSLCIGCLCVLELILRFSTGLLLVLALLTDQSCFSPIIVEYMFNMGFYLILTFIICYCIYSSYLTNILPFSYSYPFV